MLHHDEGLYESILYQEDPLIPYHKSLKQHKELRESKEYINKGISLTVEFLKSFQQLYPNIPVRDIPFRVKSLSSIDNKIKNLILERLSKLAVLNAEDPDKFIRYINAQNKKLEDNKQEKINIDYREFYHFLRERIDESSSSVLKKIDCYRQLEILENNYISHPNQYHDIVATLLNNKALSSTTKTYISRMIYAKIKLSPMLFDSEKTDLLINLTTNFGDIGKSSDILDLESVTRIFDTSTSIHNLTLTNYDNRFTSKFDRLLNEQEFLRSLDLLAFTLIVEAIPKGTQIEGFTEFNKLIQLRDQEFNADTRLNLEQKAILLLGQDFFSKISTREIPFLKDNRAKEIIDMLKHKYKPGYLAEHNKFELANNPLYSIESQIKSGYIYDTTNDRRVADKVTHHALALHSARPGKDRKLPTALAKHNPEEVSELPEYIISSIIKDLEYREPYFYTIKQATLQVIKYSHLDNTLKLNDDLIYEQPEVKDLLTAVYTRACTLSKGDIATPKKHKIAKAPTVKEPSETAPNIIINNNTLTDYE